MRGKFSTVPGTRSAKPCAPLLLADVEPRSASDHVQTLLSSPSGREIQLQNPSTTSTHRPGEPQIGTFHSTVTQRLQQRRAVEKILQMLEAVQVLVSACQGESPKALPVPGEAQPMGISDAPECRAIQSHLLGSTSPDERCETEPFLARLSKGGGDFAESDSSSTVFV